MAFMVPGGASDAVSDASAPSAYVGAVNTERVGENATIRVSNMAMNLFMNTSFLLISGHMLSKNLEFASISVIFSRFYR